MSLSVGPISPVSRHRAPTELENEARQILPPGFTLDYAGESRQLRTEGGDFLFTFLLSAVLIIVGIFVCNIGFLVSLSVLP